MAFSKRNIVYNHENEDDEPIKLRQRFMFTDEDDTYLSKKCDKRPSKQKPSKRKETLTLKDAQTEKADKVS
jgi:hypothetical protein